MSKRKKTDVNVEEEEDDDDNHSRDKSRQQGPQKTYDFHKKTIEVYPPRLLELNRQFAASISSQIASDEYSVLVGNCLDYVRQYFTYEDDLLQYSPWLATRLKQSRSNIVKCLQETIDVYEALARHDFDRILEKSNTDISLDDSTTNRNDTSAQSTATPSFQFRPLTTTSAAPAINFAKSITTTPTTTAANDSASSTGFSFAKSTATTTATTTAANDSTPLTGFSFAKSTTTTTNESTPSTGFSFAKSTPTTTANESTPSTGFTFTRPVTTTAASDSSPSTGFSFTRPVTTTAASDSSPSTGFSFKMPTTTASPDKSTNPSPFAFSLPSTGFGTSTFTSPSFGNPASTEKSATSSTSSISFAPPPKFSFGSTPSVPGEQQGTTEDNEDEPSEPPEPEKVEHEADAKLSYRCRMGVNKNGKFIKRGPVQVILKESNDKHQLIVRSDDTLGRLFLNVLWAKTIELNKNSTKDLTFVCKINPPMPEVKEGDFAMILFRFDNETDRNDAYEKLNKERT